MTRGAISAEVGQASMQSLHSPHEPSRGASGSKARSVIISPRTKKEPSRSFTSSVFFPIQPSPARSASAFSRMGLVSTQIFALAAGRSSATKPHSSSSFALTTS